MSIFSFNQDVPVVVPNNEPTEETVDLLEEDYTKAEEPEFGDDV